ncbi:unnamed protein product, partial [Didymodactylos carnosus]
SSSLTNVDEHQGDIPMTTTVLTTLVSKSVSDCYNAETHGHDYIGKRSYSRSNYSCLLWFTKSTAHTFDEFPDGSLFEAKNYCRNPDNEIGGPWCYVNEGALNWEFCDIPLCGRYI